jgi:hypothetical protein
VEKGVTPLEQDGSIEFRLIQEVQVMRPFTRHLLAAAVCIAVFSFAGTSDGFMRVVHSSPGAQLGPSLLLTGALNLVLVTALTFLVLTPVIALAEYCFSNRRSLPFYLQVPTVLLFLAAYLLPWTLFFGAWFYLAWLAAAWVLTLPLLTYWGVFRVTGLGED